MSPLSSRFYGPCSFIFTFSFFLTVAAFALSQTSNTLPDTDTGTLPQKGVPHQRKDLSFLKCGLFVCLFIILTAVQALAYDLIFYFFCSHYKPFCLHHVIIQSHSALFSVAPASAGHTQALSRWWALGPLLPSISSTEPIWIFFLDLSTLSLTPEAHEGQTSLWPAYVTISFLLLLSLSLESSWAGEDRWARLMRKTDAGGRTKVWIVEVTYTQGQDVNPNLQIRSL